MSTVTDELEKTPIQRWVKKVHFKTLANLDDLGDMDMPINFLIFEERQKRIELAKLSRPSYDWQSDREDKWLRIWFNEELLTIQIDLHFSDGEYDKFMYEIDLDRCETATSFLDWLYQVKGKAWGCPELLWAMMEVADEISEKRFNECLPWAYSTSEKLNWAKPKESGIQKKQKRKKGKGFGS
jgi:hypothetical protein